MPGGATGRPAMAKALARGPPPPGVAGSEPSRSRATRPSSGERETPPPSDLIAHPVGKRLLGIRTEQLVGAVGRAGILRRVFVAADCGLRQLVLAEKPSNERHGRTLLLRR